MRISFEEPLRDSTTYILTLDTDLRDMRGVSLNSPIILAFSTGDVIDQGRIRGQVLDPLLGSPVPDLSVLAYPIRGDTVGAEAGYRTQTGVDGTFSLSYMREGEYFVIALEDNNRDLQPSRNERFATPPIFSLLASPDTSSIESPWVVTNVDTIGPSVDRVRSLSGERIQVRFSESVVLSNLDPGTWAVRDSATLAETTVLDVYLKYNDPRSVLLRTDSLAPGEYILLPDSAITDSSGNGMALSPVSFTATARPDTFSLRFEGFFPSDSTSARSLTPSKTPEIRFSLPFSNDSIEGLVTATDSTGDRYEFDLDTDNGTSHRITFSPPLSFAVVMIRDPQGSDSTYTQVFAHAQSRDLGSISGAISPADSLVVVELIDSEGQLLQSLVPDITGAFSFNNLLQNSYHVRAFHDVNQNQFWDGGQILPYSAPEQITWMSGTIQVRPRWDTALADTLHFNQGLHD